VNAGGDVTWPRVSVVVPNYNYARFLDERLTSLLNQTFDDLELIVVDDGSTDDSRRVIDAYRSDPRVRTLYFDTNSGSVFQRWNDGAALAMGEYLMIAGADDVSAPTQLEALVRTLDAHPHVGVACSQSWEIDALGRRVKIKHGNPRFARDFILSGAQEAPHMLTEPTIQNASAALARRRLFLECGGFDLTLGMCADWMLWCRILKDSHIAYLAEPLNCYRKHDRTVRSTIRPGSDLLGQYRVVDFVLTTYGFSAADREAAWDRVARYWIGTLLGARWRADPRYHLRVYRAARRVDPGIRRRLPRIVRDRLLEGLRRRRGRPRP
jgi:glycosyltransferase involved in cell wall biosynthesis